MPRIASIEHRQVLNSHVEFTNEFVLFLEDGSVGVAASPKGETISIYEEASSSTLPSKILRQLRSDGIIMGREMSQEHWDAYLQEQVSGFGRNNIYSLSLAFAHATGSATSRLAPKPANGAKAPILCCNILNGGEHAYTNPVLSDFPEFLLVAKTNDVESTVQKHNELQKLVREKLAARPKTVVNGNPVARFETADNRECFDFLNGICYPLGFGRDFELMVDASAGDLWKNGGYRFSIAENRQFTRQEFREYWLTIIHDYGLRFLEDPFQEEDFESWGSLTAGQNACHIIGDNLYSSDALRLETGAQRKLTHGLIIKPNQAGTLTATERTIEVAQRSGQITIASHRSISTEETLIAALSCNHHLDYIKIGPLASDYSSVLRLNEILRLTTPSHG